ncbi:hypothetical protein NM208_g10010 [Fusarium decemcellulare]|uniref:Uncharacterized protein n=1 Tax=Fusarium decemcellulare TaxID=57161 RepID=A0ACC1RZF0_9HYPO|nr:hypothetical protein NM208_g10010 [Fusarium decemcellulare]
MTSTTAALPKDQRFAVKVNKNKNFNAIGLSIFLIINIAALAVSVLSYTRNDGTRPEELALCIVNGLFVLPLVASAGLAFTIKPNKRGLQKNIFSIIVTSLYTISCLVFAVLIGRRIFKDTSEGPSKSLRSGTMIINIVVIIFGIIVLSVNRPLFKALRWCNRSPLVNGPNPAYAAQTWELPINGRGPSAKH